MKWIAAGLVVLVAAGAGAAYVVFGRGAEQPTPIPPVRPVDKVIPEFVGALGKQGDERLAAIAALSHIGYGQDPSPFSTSSTSDDPRVKQYQEAMRQQRERIHTALTAAAPDLLRLANDTDTATRRGAISALGAIRAESPDAATLLAATSLDVTAESLDRQAAIVALSRVDAAGARAAIETILATPGLDPGLLSAATWSLRSMGADALPIIRPLLKDADVTRRAFAFSALRGIPPAEAAPAASDLAESIPVLPPRMQTTALRALIAMAPEDVTTLQTIIATPSYTRNLCSTALDTLNRRPGAVTLDYKQVCLGHAENPGIAGPFPAVDRALIAASGGKGDLVVSRAESTQIAGESPERVVVGCIEPKGSSGSITKWARNEGPKPTGTNELRIAAVRVAGDDTVIDSTGGLISTDTTAASCEKITVDRMTDPTRWPQAQVELITMQAGKSAATMVQWSGQIDVGSHQWKLRVPALVYHLRDDGTMFSDQLFADLTPSREFHVVGRWSGIDAPVAVEMPALAARYAPAPPMLASSGIPSVIVPAKAMTGARWTRLVMYPMDFSGAPRSKPVIPEGTPVATMTGAFVLPYEPELPDQLKKFWRPYLTHDHLSVRLMAASKLAELKDRESLPGIVNILTMPTDVAAQAVGAIQPFGADAVPYLEPLLHDKRPLVRKAAWLALGKMGAAAVPAVRKALESGPEEERALAAGVLKDLRPAPVDLVPAVLPVIRSCQSPQGSTMHCWDLLTYLSATGPAAAAAQPVLTEWLETANGYARVQIASTLVAVGDSERGMAAIVETARTGKDNDAESALRYLTSSIKADALPIFIEVLQRRDASMASAYAAQQIAILSPAPEAAYPAVSALARDADPAMRRRAIPALKGFRSAEATALLGRLTRDPDTAVQRAAFDLLKDRGLEAVPLMAHLLDAPGNPLRSDLLYQLQRLGAPVAAASPAVMRSLERLSREDPEIGIRNQAQRTLNEIRGVKPQ